MKTIKQKEHTSFKLLNLANGDMRVTLDTGLSGINFSIPLILESEFRREVALAICNELSQPSKQITLDFIKFKHEIQTKFTEGFIRGADRITIGQIIENDDKLFDLFLKEKA